MRGYVSCWVMCLVCEATKSGEQGAWRGRQVSAGNTYDGAREQPRCWLFSADSELCGCSVSMDNLEFTTRCRIMQRSQTKSVFSFLVKWSLLIFLMK